MQESSSFESILARDRTIIIAGLVTVIVLSWLYILLGAGMDMPACEMPTMTGGSSTTDMVGDSRGMSAPQERREAIRPAPAALLHSAVWTPTYAGLMMVMWWVMMVAMMVPSASPMILLYARIQRSQRMKGAPFVPTSVFAAGYLVVWGAFSVLAAGTQWGLERTGLLSAMLSSTSGLFAGSLLLGVGLYQLTPLKHACLRHCRSPLQFMTHHWRNGTSGALHMGIKHGVFCLGCCWLLMGLLFVGGVMNLYWIIGLAVFVLLEKTLPAGHWLGALTGIGLIVAGGWFLTGTLL
jgi:predicted metal-binding membrane protein